MGGSGQTFRLTRGQLVPPVLPGVASSRALKSLSARSSPRSSRKTRCCSSGPSAAGTARSSSFSCCRIARSSLVADMPSSRSSACVEEIVSDEPLATALIWCDYRSSGVCVHLIQGDQTLLACMLPYSIAELPLKGGFGKHGARLV